MALSSEYCSLIHHCHHCFVCSDGALSLLQAGYHRDSDTCADRPLTCTVAFSRRRSELPRRIMSRRLRTLDIVLPSRESLRPTSTSTSSRFACCRSMVNRAGTESGCAYSKVSRASCSVLHSRTTTNLPVGLASLTDGCVHPLFVLPPIMTMPVTTVCTRRDYSNASPSSRKSSTRPGLGKHLL